MKIKEILRNLSGDLPLYYKNVTEKGAKKKKFQAHRASRFPVYDSGLSSCYDYYKPISRLEFNEREADGPKKN